MTLFEEIVAELLCENLAPGTINDAIDRTYEVKINYSSGGNGSASGERIIQPVAYGLSKAGNPVIRAFQPYGDTKTKTPAWKLFRVDRIISWKPMRKKIFRNRPPEGYEAEGVFNDNGDKSMSVVYNVAVFGPKQKGVQTTGPITKSTINAKNNSNRLDNMPNNMDIIGNNDTSETDNNTINGPVTKSNLFKTQTEKDIESRWKQWNKHERVPQSVIDGWKREEERKNGKTSGPITKADIEKPKAEPNLFKTQTEKDIESRWEQWNKHERVPQSVIDGWKKEEERKKGKNKKESLSGPVTKTDIKKPKTEPNLFKTQTEKDIESRWEQWNKHERVPQSVIDSWKREEQEKENRRNKNGNNNFRFKSGSK